MPKINPEVIKEYFRNNPEVGKDITLGDVEGFPAENIAAAIFGLIEAKSGPGTADNITISPQAISKSSNTSGS